MDINFAAIDSFELDEHLILLRKNSHRLQILNPLASLIWQLNKDGLSEQQIANEISLTFDIPIDLALQDVNAISAQWALDLTEPPAKKLSKKKGQMLGDEGATWQPDMRLFFAFPRVTVKVNFDSRVVAEKVRSMLSILEVPENQKIDIELDIISSSDAFLIVKDGLIRQQTKTESYTALMVCHQITDLACKQHDWLVILHAAGVSWRGDGIVFPALGGSGKTTLTAGLLKHGFDYINDDVIPLLRKTHEMISLPVNLSIKSGSWPLLQSLYPELEELEIFGNQERSIKYLPPPLMQNPPQSHHARHIILPDYRAGATPELTELSTVAALQAIIEAESLLHLPLNKADVADLLNWLSPLTCHRLSYDALDPAVALLTQFCKENCKL